MSAPASAPPPLHIIRSHGSAVSALFISGDNERIYSGDVSGLVVITSTRSLRSVASWKAHTDGLLGVEEWGKQVITHGRDNKLHVWRLPSRVPSTVRGSASPPGNALTPELAHSLDVNALNFCRFSLLLLDAPPSSTSTSSTDMRWALVAIPNLIESSLADIWALPSMERIHAAIGKSRMDDPVMLGSDGRGVKNPTGIIMSMHLLPTPPGAATEMADRALSLLVSYENGSVKLWRYRDVEKERSIEGLGWECVWSIKLHVESVMATAVSPDRSIALSVSADHLVGRYDLNVGSNSNVEPAGTVYRTKYPGNGAIAFHDDGRVCALGGWDGRVRLVSTKSFKPLGTLIYHKAAVQALAFARASPVATRLHRPHPHHQDHLGHHYHYHSPPDSANSGAGGGGGGGYSGTVPGTTCSLRDVRDSGRSGGGDGDRGDDDQVDEHDNHDDRITPVGADGGEKEEAREGEEREEAEAEGQGDEGNDDDDDEMSTDEKAGREQWLVSGGKDGRVVVWALMDFAREGHQKGWAP